MVQKLLCRWWYAMEWPAKEDLGPAPESYEALEGYPGVFICVEVSVDFEQLCFHVLAALLFR